MRLALSAFGMLLAFSALAHEARDGAAAPDLFGENATPVAEQRLESLRGQRPAPTQLQQVGVVLWDEPRPGVPPARSAEPQGAPQLQFSVSVR